MRIGIWWRITDQPWGGGNSFLRSLSAQLQGMGHTISHTPDGRQDVVLVNSWNLGPGMLNSAGRVAEVRARGRRSPLGALLPHWLWSPLGRRGPALVHRVDGVARLSRGRAGRWDPIQFAVNRLCDLTIFQSEYCRASFASAGVAPGHSTVVHNAVDPGVFYPGDDRPRNKRLTLIANSWSTNPRKGFDWLARVAELPGVEVRFIGRWPAETAPGAVVRLGAMQASEIAVTLRDADAFMHAGANESCSNVILEALATGLPVLYLDSGGNRELAAEFGVELRDDVGASVRELSDRRLELRRAVLSARNRFLMPRAATEYLEAFRTAIDRRRGNV